MVLRPLLVFATLALSAASSGAQDWKGPTFKRVREATPCVMGTNTGSKSGILFRKTDAGGWVLTMGEAVGTLESVNVVFGMGTDAERTLTGRVVAHSENETLACLWVEGKDLPEALPIGERPEVAEGEDIFLPGYLFEIERAGPKTSVPIELARMKFRSISRDNFGDFFCASIEGDANSGRSGAPAMTAKGEVLGICDAKPVGGRQASVMTPAAIRRFFRRHMAKVTGTPAAVTREDMKLQARVVLLDPLQQIHTLTFLFIREEEVPALASRVTWKEQARASAGMEEVTLDVDAEASTAAADVPFKRKMDDAQSVRLMVQLKITETDGREFFTLPTMLDVAFAPDPVADPVPAPQEVPAFDLALPETLKVGRSAGMRCVTGELLASPDGASVYVLDLSQGRALRLDAATLKVTGEFAAAGVVRCMALTPDGKNLVVAGFDPAAPTDNVRSGVAIVQLVATDTMKLAKELHPRGHPAAVAASNTHIVLALDNQGHCIVVVEIERGTEADADGGYPWSYLRLHPDGTRVYLGDQGMSPSDFRCLPLRPDPRQSRFVSYDSRYHGECPLGHDFEISPDGHFLVGSTGSVLRLSKSASDRDDLEYVASIDRFVSAALAPGATSFLTATETGFIKQYDLPTFKLRTSVSIGLRCAKMLLDGKGKRLIATVSPLQKEEFTYGRNLPVCDLVEIPLEGK